MVLFSSRRLEIGDTGGVRIVASTDYSIFGGHGLEKGIYFLQGGADTIDFQTPQSAR
jgi:hypothetical protein